MPLSLNDLRQGIRTIKVETLAGDVNVTYKLGAVTPTIRNERDKPGMLGVASLLSYWIEKWDLMDGDEMYPITEESLCALPESFLLDVYAGINGDTRFRPTKKAGSFSGS